MFNLSHNNSPWIQRLRDLVAPSIQDTASHTSPLDTSFSGHSLPPLTPRAQHLLNSATILHDQLTTAVRLPVTTFVVGGALRDIFRQSPPRDLDLEIVAPWRTLVNALPSCDLVSQIVARPEYRSVTCTLTNGEVVDIASPSGVIQGSIEDHVKTFSMRRGFTLNSIYYDVASEKLFDPFHGVEDIKRGVLTTLPGTRIDDDPRLFFIGVANILRFGLSVSDETKSEFCRVGTLLDQRWSGGKVPQKIVRLIDKIIDRGLDIPQMCEQLLTFGYLKSCFGKDIDTAQRAITHMAHTSRAPLAYDFAHQRWLPTVAELVVQRTSDTFTTDTRAIVALGILTGLGFGSGSIRINQVRTAVEHQETLRHLTKTGESGPLVSLSNCSADALSYATEALKAAHPTSRLAVARDAALKIHEMFSSPNTALQIFICSKKLIEDLSEGQSKPFLIVCGPESHSQVRTFASSHSMDVRRRSDISCQLTDSTGKRIDIVHLRSMPEIANETISLVIHNRESRTRIASAGGALFNISTTQLFALKHPHGTSQ